MRIKHTLLVAIVAGSLLITNSAYGAVKQGSSCKKAGTTSTVNGLKYTCVKSGKKLVWSKGVKVSNSCTNTNAHCYSFTDSNPYAYANCRTNCASNII